MATPRSDEGTSTAIDAMSVVLPVWLTTRVPPSIPSNQPNP
jgi:hypothetical protein